MDKQRVDRMREITQHAIQDWRKLANALKVANMRNHGYDELWRALLAMHDRLIYMEDMLIGDEPVQPLQNPPPADNATAADGPSQDDEQPLTEAEKHSEGISDSEAYWHELDDHDGRAYDADAADLNAERRALHYGDESPPSIEDLRYEAAERRFLRSAEREAQYQAEERGEAEKDDNPPDPEDLIW